MCQGNQLSEMIPRISGCISWSLCCLDRATWKELRASHILDTIIWFMSKRIGHCTTMHSVHNSMPFIVLACGLSFYIPTFKMIVLRWLSQSPSWHLLWILSNTCGTPDIGSTFHGFCLVNFYFLHVSIPFLRMISVTDCI